MFCVTVMIKVALSVNTVRLAVSVVTSVKRLFPKPTSLKASSATVVYEKAEGAETAIEKCPMKCIRDFSTGYPEGSSFTAPNAPAKQETAA